VLKPCAGPEMMLSNRQEGFFQMQYQLTTMGK